MGFAAQCVMKPSENASRMPTVVIVPFAENRLDQVFLRILLVQGSLP